MDHDTTGGHDDATNQPDAMEAERDDPEPESNTITPVKPTRPGSMGKEVSGTSAQEPQVLRVPELVAQSPSDDSDWLRPGERLGQNQSYPGQRGPSK